MRSAELTVGRTFGVVFEPGEDFFFTLNLFCDDHGIRQGYIPMFVAAFSEVEIVGACGKLDDPGAPVWSSVHLSNVEAVGAGTFAWTDEYSTIVPHIHVSVGEKARSATGYTSHLLSARTQFLVEMVVVEVVSPALSRRPDPQLYDVPLLTFGGEAPALSGPGR